MAKPKKDEPSPPVTRSEKTNVDKKDAHTKVNFGVAWVFSVSGHQGQDLVFGLFFQMLQHHASPVAIFRSSYMPHSAQDPS